MTDSYEHNLTEELEYLKNTLDIIEIELHKGIELQTTRKSKLLAFRQEMWDETVHFSSDFDRLTEFNQYLTEENILTANFIYSEKLVVRYTKVKKTPYFGRFDFIEDGFEDQEKIYIGLSTIMNPDTRDILVYDWRSPISSIFYQYELGKASYQSPSGIFSGSVTLKRQYKIENSELKYFFDCSIKINDEMLQEVLCRNSSAKMRNIVETIQKEQDIIIRDTDNELLIVQGVAGSGKTSIALHRIAFLLYHGLSSNLNSNNILIISPNSTFSKYISNVLPELGEDQVKQTTFDDLVTKHFEDRLTVETRNMQLEALILQRNDSAVPIKRQNIKFKGSRQFLQIIDRLIQHYERRLIPFEDVYFDGKLLETKQQLKSFLLKDRLGMPLAKRLKIIENRILDQIKPLQKKRLQKIQRIVENSEGHTLEVKSFSRLLSIKKTKGFIKRLHNYTKIDYLDLYQRLFHEQELFSRLAKGLQLPENIEQIILDTKESLAKGQLYFEDCAPLLYLKLRIEGSPLFSEIKQVVIDEAQDYYPLQYEIFKLLFRDARYTVLGDIHQSVEKEIDTSIYDNLTEILHKKKTLKLTLNKSYRSSYEITAFTQKLLDNNQGQDFVSFERHEAEPKVKYQATLELIDLAIVQDIGYYIEQGYQSIAVLCKSQKEAEEIHVRLKNSISIELFNTIEGEVDKGAIVIPVYMAKGLEFDVVIIYNASQNNYANSFDRQLLYIACTRAMHQLVLYYTEKKCSFIDTKG
ncbi:MAG: HelD family protein [Desulfitobacteriaceae bacterium]